MNMFHYNITITCAHIGGLIQADWHVLIRNIGLKIKWRLSNNRPFFWSRLTGFRNKRHTTALLLTTVMGLIFSNWYIDGSRIHSFLLNFSNLMYQCVTLSPILACVCSIFFLRFGIAMGSKNQVWSSIVIGPIWKSPATHLFPISLLNTVKMS